jgi:site-specific DNA-methyltransferase (adenine-specific)
MIIKTDCIEGLRSLDSESINCIITSPPYNKKGLQGKSRVQNQVWKKFEINYSDYGDDMNEEEYQSWMIEFLNECHRVIKKDGSIFFNHKPRRHKNRVHLPTEFISKSNAELFQLIIWDRRNSPNLRKENLVPSTEHIYWLCKDKPKSFRDSLDKEYIGEVWRIIAERQKDHPAPFPQQLVENCILLSTEEGDTVLDPFMGSGTTAIVANQLNRNWLGFEISQEYIDIAEKRLEPVSTLEEFIISL